MLFENRVPHKPVLVGGGGGGAGACPVLHIPLLVMNSLNKTEFAISISLMLSLLPKDLINQNLLV